MLDTTAMALLFLQFGGLAGAARLSLKSTDINALHNTALAVARSNPKMEGLRFFVGYNCDPNHPFNCIFSTCQADGLCGCNDNETTFLGMLCLPSRRLGESCIDNQQCRKMNRNSRCEVPKSLTVGICKCSDGSFGSNATCNRMVSITSADPDPKEQVSWSRVCSATQQCQRFGKHAECNLFMQSCECEKGYRLDEKDHQCKDIDECKELPSTDTCRGSADKNVDCVNTEGGFTCYCRTNKGRNNGKVPSGICCSDNQLPCDKEPKCIDFSLTCDGFPDCANGYDENFDFCIKPKLSNITDGSSGMPNRMIGLLHMEPVDPLPFAQF